MAPPRPARPRPWLQRLAICLLLALGWLAFEASRIEALAAPFVSSDLHRVPQARVGLVLGCSEFVADGRHNLFFDRRMAAAAALFHANKVSYLLVSGDNSRPNYDEPSAMRRALERAGVPSSRIVLDYAGFRTLDSVVRAKDVFGVKEVVFVSQHFHNLRAVYLARAHGMVAYGYDAKDVGGVGGLWPKLREVASRAFAVLDVQVLGTTPRYGGPREITPLG